MRVLLLPSEYVEPGRPLAGIFYKDQALAAHRAGVRVDAVVWELRSLRTLGWRALRENHFQKVVGEEEGVLTMRQKAWNPVLNTAAGARLWTLLMARLVHAYVRRYGVPDLIHAHNALWGGYVASRVARTYGVPYVVTEHSSAVLGADDGSALARPLSRAYGSASRVIAVSRSLARAIRKYTTDQQLLVVPNVVKTDFFGLPAEEPARNPFVFLCVGKLVAVKQFDLLIRAFAGRYCGCAGVQLRVVGDGPLRPALQALTHQLGVAGQVHFLGEVDREQVRRAMWNAHALVLSSRSETFGVVLVEALATGLPVIATRCGGPEDVVSPEVGLLVPSNDQEALAVAMEQMRTRPPYDRRLLRQYAVQRFSENTIGQSLLRIYSSVVGSRQELCAVSAR